MKQQKQFDSEINIKTPRLILRSFGENDVTQRYVEWLNNKDTNRYLESRFQIQNIKSVKSWVSTTNADPTRFLLGIFKNTEHIGNITFYMIEHIHKTLRVGITIGCDSLRQQGYASEALKAALNYIFGEMLFDRVEAGIYQGNTSSVNLFCNVGFHHEATFKNRLHFEGAFIDMLLFVIFKNEYLELQKTLNETK